MSENHGVDGINRGSPLMTKYIFYKKATLSKLFNLGSYFDQKPTCSMSLIYLQIQLFLIVSALAFGQIPKVSNFRENRKIT